MAGTNQLEKFSKQQISGIVEAPVFTGTNASLLEMVQLHAQVLLPVLRAFQTEIGEERANHIARTALQQSTHTLSQDIGAQIPGDPRQKWEAICAALIQRFNGDVDVAALGQEPDMLECSATESCSEDIFRELGEQELRWALACDVDFDIANVSDSEVRIDSVAKENEYCEVW